MDAIVLKNPGTTMRRLGHSLCASVSGLLELRVVNALNRRLPELMQLHGVPGVQCALAIGHHAVKEIAFGSADAGAGRAMTTRTRFCMGSLSKPVTATVLLDLASEGRLELDAPIAQLIGSDAETLHEGLSDMTCRQLLAHAAEVPHVDSAWYLQDEAVPSGLQFERTSVRQFRDAVIDTSKHSRAYTSRGYSILQIVVERCVGRSFDTIAASLFKRIGVQCSFDPVCARDPWIARDHDGGVMPQKWTPALAASGLVGTAGDHARIMQWALRERHRNCINDLFKRGIGALTPYTCGLHVWKDKDERILDHGGARKGMRGVLKVIPEAEIVFVMLANGENGVEVSRTFVGLVEELGLAHIALWA